MRKIIFNFKKLDLACFKENKKNDASVKGKLKKQFQFNVCPQVGTNSMHTL